VQDGVWRNLKSGSLLRGGVGLESGRKTSFKKGIVLFYTLLLWAALFLCHGKQPDVDALLPTLPDLPGVMGRIVEKQMFYEAASVMLSLLACYLWQLLADRVWPVKGLGAVALILGVFFRMHGGQNVSKPGTALSFFYGVLVLAEWVQVRWPKQRQGNGGSYLFWLSPFFAIYLAALLFSPAPKEPYDWQWFLDACSRVQEGFETFSHRMFHGRGDDFGMPVSGFSEEGRLFGSLRTEEEPMLVVKRRSAQVDNLYLTGRVFDRFDGLEWVQTEGGSAVDNTLDAMETLYAVLKKDTGYEGDYLKEVYLEVEYRDLNTRCLFAPIKTRTAKGTEAELLYGEEDGSLFFGGRRGYGTSYQVRYYQMNLSNPVFRELLQEADAGRDAKVWEQTGKRFGLGNGKEYDWQGLLAHRERIRERYTDVPQISDEVEGWLEEVTAGADSDYEKLRDIEGALLQLAYDTGAGGFPETVGDGASFLDYFLLEEKAGYCAHFATAFVLLARAEGIPARYVQGFCVPIGENVSMEVYSGMAHAWPEAYIEGVGWIPFEPTPGYGQNRYISWETTDQRRQRETAETSGTVFPEKHERPVPGDAEPGSREEEHAEPGWVRLMPYGLCVLAAAAVLLFLTDMFRDSCRRRRRTVNERFRVEVMRSIQILSALGLVRSESETLTELDRRLQVFLVRQKRTDIVFLRMYEEQIYGGREIGEEVLKQLKQEQGVLYHLLFGRTRRLYPLYRFKLYLFRYRY